MSDDGKCYAATPAATLEEHIVNSNVAKSDTEWWAHHEITRLRADLAAAIEERDRIREALRPFAAMASVNNMQDYAEAPDDCVMTAGSWGNKPLLTFRLGDLRRARAAIEGVTEKEGEGNE